MSSDKNQNLASLCQRHYLDYQTLLIHQQRIAGALRGRSPITLKITDTCRIDNGGLQPRDWLNTQSQMDLSGFVAFVPAAGASSRYFQVFGDFLNVLAGSDKAKIFAALQPLKSKNLAEWALFKEFKALLNLKSASDLTAANIEQLKELFSLPKALVPCTIEGHTFLKMKLLEHQAMGFLDGQIFVAGLSKYGLFENALQVDSTGVVPQCKIYTQGPNESTVRFNEDLTPAHNQTGELSVVPAGHGTLAGLIPNVENDFPDAHSVFIRNVDNVMGTSKAALDAVRVFLSQHKFLLLEIKKIRQFLGHNAIDSAAKSAQQILQGLNLPVFDSLARDQVLEKLGPMEQSLWKLLYDVFHFYEPADKVVALSGSQRLTRLSELYNRPVNSLGQVPNTRNDVGGTPVFVELDDKIVKICLEVPHASPSDKEAFLQNPQKATHFNPVFAAAEIRPLPAACYEPEFPFWILTERQYEGRKVYYHESVLYELLGNSLHANVIFVEVPRIIFNPHKSVIDTEHRKIGDWLSA